MTRRVIAYRESGMFYVSQEFNGDRSEIVNANLKL